MHEINNTKKELAKSVEVDLYAIVNEEEFTDAIDAFTRFLLFGTRWEELAIKNPKIRKTIPTLSDIPLQCKAYDCIYASKCPILKALDNKRDGNKLIGTDCRADQIHGVETFTALVKDMQIEPDQTTDIMTVAQIVRNLIFKRRIDWSIAIEGMELEEPTVIDQRSGQVHFKKVSHHLHNLSAQLDKQIAALQKQLMADRAARATLAASLGKNNITTLANLFAGKALPDGVIEGEIIDIAEDEE